MSTKRKQNDFEDSYEGINRILKRAKIDKTAKRNVLPEEQDILSNLNLRENLKKVSVFCFFEIAKVSHFE